MSNLSPPVPGMQNQGLLLAILKPGDSGNAVRIIQSRLSDLGYHTGLIDGDFGHITQRSLAAFQRARGLPPTGLVDHHTLQALGYQLETSSERPSPNPNAPSHPRQGIPVETIAKLFADAPLNNLRNYWPLILRALGEQGLGDRTMILMALATIRAETAGFAPISEYQSQYNTEPGGRPYAKYDFRSDIGNNARGDGDRYKGRGFVQLTGKSNYQTYSHRLGMGDLLLHKPELANDPIIAARLLAVFLKSKETTIRQALSRNDLATARKAVNGGTHGLAAFQETFQKGAKLI